MKNYDVIVVGLGAMGSAASFHLASRGLRVLGLEQYDAVHDRGSSHGGSRIIRQSYHEDPAYVPLLQRAYELWDQLERESGHSILELTGGLMIGPPGSDIVNGARASAEQHHLPYEMLDSAELKRRFPVFQPRSDETAFYELKAGYLRPERAVRAHLEQAAKHGAELHFEEPVLQWRALNAQSGVEVVTEAGRYEAERIVIAPGAWAPQILRELGIDFDVRRHVMAWFRPELNEAAFLPDRCPIYIWDVNGRDCFYGFPAAADGLFDGAKVAMHSGGERTTAVGMDRSIREDDVSELRGYLARFLPGLNGKLQHAAACMYTLTPDEHFVITVHPAHPQVTVAAGFSGHGFKFSNVVSEILADLATRGVTSYPIDLFSPARFSVLHS